VPIACSGCGAITVQPRYTIYWRVVSFVVGTLRQPVQGVFCRSCADRRGLIASATTWALGWWGLPWGPFWTVKALWCNLRGGERPADVNASLLRQQALYFWATGKPVLARAALTQALRMVQRPELRQKLEKMRTLICEPGREQLVDRWRLTASPAFYLHLLPVLAMAAGVVVVTVNLTASPPSSLRAASPPSPPVAVSPPVTAAVTVPAPAPAHWHVTAASLILRDGPGAGHLPIGRLHQSDPVEIVSRVDGWARIRTATGQIGFVALEFLEAEGKEDEAE